MTDLPTSWHICTFGDVASIRNGFAFKSTDFLKTKESPEDIPLVRQSQLVGATVDLSNAVFLPAHFFALHQGYVIETGDLIIGMSGSIGAVCQYKETVPALQNQRTGKITLRFKDAMSDRFFGLFLMNVETELKKLSKGMGVQNISGKDIEALSLALPPLPEQHRIVAKIEELFSELDAGTASLTRARAQLKTYRQALLKAAFEGKLTAPWRAANPAKLEPPETLLSRIRKERDAANKSDALEPGYQPEIAETEAGWAWASLDLVTASSLIGLVRSNAVQNAEENGASYIKMDRVDMDGRVSISPEIFVTVDAEEAMRYSLNKGDILFNTRNSLELVGKTGILRSEPAVTTVFNNNLMRIRPIKSVMPEFLAHQMCGHIFRRRMERVKKATTSVAAVYGKDLWPLPLVIPSLSEQALIVEILEEKLSSVNAIESEITTALTRITALRQSILKKAFSGQLVPQDPADEPASALLARLAQAPAPKLRRKTKP